MKIEVIVQARMSSRRLPGKSLRELRGRPLIGHVFGRLSLLKYADKMILATSAEASDDALADYVQAQGIDVYRGELDNVQARFMGAAEKSGADIIVRVTGDNPFISPELIDIMLLALIEKNVDYVGYSSCVHGIGAEAFRMKAFRKAVELSSSDYDFEHVTPPFYQKKDEFNSLFLEAPAGFVCPELSLSVDTEEDFQFAESVLEYCHDDVDIPGIVDAWKKGILKRSK